MVEIMINKNGLSIVGTPMSALLSSAFALPFLVLRTFLRKTVAVFLGMSTEIILL